MKFSILDEYIDNVMSPSSRRAWIEIKIGTDVIPSSIVALLAEGVA